MVSVMSASLYIMSASRYHPRYQSRSSMYIRGMISRNFVELAEAVLIAGSYVTYLPLFTIYLQNVPNSVIENEFLPC